MKHKHATMTPAEIEAADRRLREQKPNAEWGTSKHRKARINKFASAQKKKRRKR